MLSKPIHLPIDQDAVRCAAGAAGTCITLAMCRTGNVSGLPAASWPRCMYSSTTVSPAAPACICPLVKCAHVSAAHTEDGKVGLSSLGPFAYRHTWHGLEPGVSRPFVVKGNP